MNKKGKKFDLLLACILNVVFLFIYLNFFELIQESNDDLAMSYLAEGVYGGYTGSLVFENIYWGRFLVFLNQLIPAVKWYNVLHYVVIFLAFLEITYVFIRRMGRKMGSIASAVMLVFCGYESYVMFQFSRITAIGTIGGILMLFYAIEHAEDKEEKRWCCASGIFLSIWASMLRFQMYALSVALVLLCLGVYRIWKWIKEKDKNWWKELKVYLSVFGLVAVVSVGLYAIDRAHYEKDPEWKEYLEYNELRANLWDTGFPNYYDYIVLYDEFGITEHDYQYYIGWNMDEEVLTKDTLQTLVSAKNPVRLNIPEYLQYYPHNFINLTLFIVFLVVSIFAVTVNVKNLYYVFFEFGLVFLAEMLFFHMCRFGWERVDNGMWMAAIVVVLYGMADDLAKVKLNTWKWLFAVSGVCMLLNVMDLRDKNHFQEGVIGSTKAFYDQVTKDEEHLYVILAGAPSPYYAYDFWEPSGAGDFSNTYNVFGWEYNLGLKKQVLENWGIENVYRDSINNDKVYFVPGTQVESLQLYFQENYGENTYLHYEKEYMGVALWSIRTVDTIVQE